MCVHIHKSKEQSRRRGGGAAASASESLLLFHSPPTHALRHTNHPASSHPLCVIPATRTLPPSAATPASAHTQWWIRTRFCVVASLRLVSTVSMLSSSRSLPPPFDSFALTFYACYSFALLLCRSLSSFTFIFCFTVATAGSLPSCATFHSCHLRVISLRLSRVCCLLCFDCALSLCYSLRFALSCSERLNANASACSFALVCFALSALFARCVASLFAF